MSNEVFEMDLAPSPPSPSFHNQAIANSQNEQLVRTNSDDLFPDPFLEPSANAHMDADATIGTLEPQVGVSFHE